MFAIRIKFEILIILLFVFFDFIETTQLGFINNTNFSTSKGINISANGSCTNCICAMLLNDDIIAVNCLQQEICTFYSNYTIPYVFTNETNSAFYFRDLSLQLNNSFHEQTNTTRSCSSATILINADSSGSDIDSKQTPTLGDCCIWCLSHSSCIAFAWISLNSSRSEKLACYRKHKVGSTLSSTGITYGYF